MVPKNTENCYLPRDNGSFFSLPFAMMRKNPFFI
jgi:hypothetical protein